MLEFKTLNSPLDRLQLLENFDPQKQTWVVSDLKSKFEIQNYIIQKQGYFEDHCVLRANEFWSTLLKRWDSSYKIISRDFLKSWMSELLQNSKYDLLKNQGLETLMDVMDSFSQVFSHSEGYDLVSNWLDENQQAKERWGFWFEAANDFSKVILTSKKLTPTWVAPFLSNHVGWENGWSRPLIVDLGAELSRAEASLLTTLSATLDLKILEPHSSLQKKFNYLLKPYEEIRGFSKGHANLKIETHLSDNELYFPKSERTFHKLTSPLAEVKLATQMIRKWIEAGVSPTDISIISCDIEKYWPLIQAYFSEEGIPVSKDLSVRLQSFPWISRWISQINLTQKNFEYYDLETLNYGISNPEKRFETFEAVFKNLLDESDLSRDSQIKEAYLSHEIPKEPISRNQFIGHAIQFWSDQGPIEHLQIILKEILEISDSSVHLKFENWAQWVRNIVGKSEIKILRGSKNGVQIINMLSADSPFYKKRIFLGITESDVSEKHLKIISVKEIEKIFSDTGFHLKHPEQSLYHYQLIWSSRLPLIESNYFSPMTSMNGQPEAPHPFWVEGVQNQNIKISIPEETRWDSIQMQNEFELIAKERQWSVTQKHAMDMQIQCDQGLRNYAFIQKKEQMTLSPSALEVFHQCSFKFAASRLFCLQDPSEIDIDPDSRLQGQLVHRLFYLLTEEPRRFDWTKEEILKILDECYSKNPFLSDAPLWGPLREKLYKLAQQFISFEKKWIESSKIKTEYREWPFQFEYQSYKWKGSIDRIDVGADGKLALYDYKPKNREFQFSQWFKKNHLQLAFYSWAIQGGYVNELKDKVLQSAMYYIYKDFSFKGLQDNEKKLFEISFLEIEEKIKNMLSHLQSGNFEAKPADENTCEYCKWSQLCRAPHLNH